MNKPSLLSIEDSHEIQILIKKVLGFDYNLFFAKSIEDAMKVLNEKCFNLILLDIELPDGDGLRLCSQIKNTEKLKNTPIFILSGKNSIQEKTLGFKLGVDDYIVKPFDALELKVRVDAKIKKTIEIELQKKEIIIDRLKIDSLGHRVEIKDGELWTAIELSTKEFGILFFLAKNINQVKSREQIISTVWSYGFNVSDRTIDSHVSRIRKKIMSSNIKIEAVSNIGYRLCMKAD